ncbi:DUF2806 domain-containing protein [Hymenobacter sp. UV11]|uniref:DUF2806 domain-containing protein n=1 Tax=Hymenobacter sp. UV11 TaxID=1849735 RepID=UPI00105DD7DA|nr:DUF2806 domain-containing protein [Hymenobacter sp. UV11]TFZ66499.1 DUF2806 domain-containing protein [Hymenobacter sp. UV11]
MTPTEGILGLLTAAVAGNPASVFIEKVSAAIEGGLKPWQLRRVASAEMDASVIKAEGDGKIAEIQQRAALRVAAEEVRNQQNIEAAIIKALPNIKADAKPEEMDNDWLANFFDKCRLISNEEMQKLWAQVLAGEANSPGSFSHRTINFLSSMSQKDAEDFRLLCSYGWYNENGSMTPVIFKIESEDLPIKISFNQFQHLEDIGLIKFQSGMFSNSYSLLKNCNTFSYLGRVYEIKCKSDSDASEKDRGVSIGKIILTKLGDELALVCQPVQDEKVVEYTFKVWEHNHIITEVIK